MPDDSPIYTVPQMHEGQAPVLQAMLQTLLADRFKLVLQREMKRMPVYVLTVAKGGPKLRPSKDDEKPALNVSGSPAVQGSDRVLIGSKASMEKFAFLAGTARCHGSSGAGSYRPHRRVYFPGQVRADR
jgi:uncharacterized protein (TIGR03435 family)